MSVPDKPDYSCFDVEIETGVAHLRLKRPEALNTMTRAFWNELPAIIRDIDDNARARCIVISSTGKHFCAGMLWVLPRVTGLRDNPDREI